MSAHVFTVVAWQVDKGQAIAIAAIRTAMRKMYAAADNRSQYDTNPSRRDLREIAERLSDILEDLAIERDGWVC